MAQKRKLSAAIVLPEPPLIPFKMELKSGMMKHGDRIVAEGLDRLRKNRIVKPIL